MRNEADDSMKEFMREMRSVRNSAAGENEADPGLVRGKRTGVKVERKRVRKDSTGLDDIDSFWDNAVSNTTTPQSETSAMTADSSGYSSVRSSPSESSAGLSPESKTLEPDQDSSEENEVVHIERSTAIRRLRGPETPSSLQQDSDEMSTDEEVIDFTAPSPGSALSKKRHRVRTPQIRRISSSPEGTTPHPNSDRRSMRAYGEDSDFSTPRVSADEGSEGEGGSGRSKTSCEKPALMKGSVKKTPPGRYHSRSPSSKKRPQPVHLDDIEPFSADEIVDFGDNDYDDMVSEEEHEGSGSPVKVKGNTGSKRKSTKNSGAVKETESSGKEDSKNAQKSNKEDIKPKVRQPRVNTRAAESRGSIARRVATKETTGGKTMRIVPLTDLNEKGPKSPGVRRSSRAHVEPIRWWKNEHVMYKKPKTIEDVPSIYAVEIAPPTPMVQQKRHDKRHKKKRMRDKFMEQSQSAELEYLRDEEMPRIKGKRMKTQETCVVWDDEVGGIETKQIVKRYSSMAHKKLKASTVRHKGMEGTGSAAQCFNARPSGGIGHWISGSLVLPPQAIKDAEHVSVSTQLYWITRGQPGSIELSLAMPCGSNSSEAIFDPDDAQRYLLSPGDHFVIPSNNIYRIENLSSKVDVHICWLILKPFSKPQT